MMVAFFIAAYMLCAGAPGTNASRVSVPDILSPYSPKSQTKKAPAECNLYQKRRFLHSSRQNRTRSGRGGALGTCEDGHCAENIHVLQKASGKCQSCRPKWQQCQHKWQHCCRAWGRCQRKWMQTCESVVLRYETRRIGSATRPLSVPDIAQRIRTRVRGRDLIST